MPLSLIAILASMSAIAQQPAVLDRESFRRYVPGFNSIPTPDVASFIPEGKAWDWMRATVPFFACPDPDFERTWYYRWRAYRKHIRRTPAGFIVTEFLRPGGHATDHNTISWAVGHHIAEGRWLRDARNLNESISFWLRSGPKGGLQRHYHQCSNRTAAAVWERYLANARKDALLGLLAPLLADYTAWEKELLLHSGLFWQYDVCDGM